MDPPVEVVVLLGHNLELAPQHAPAEFLVELADPPGTLEVEQPDHGASKMREMHQFSGRQMTPQDKARIEKQRKEAAELTQQRTYGVRTARRFFATEPRDKSWKPVPKPAKSPKEDKLETIEDLKRAVKELRDNSPIKAYVPSKDIPVPEDPPPRRRRQFGG